MNKEPQIIAAAPEYHVFRDGTIVRFVARDRTKVGKVLRPWLKDGYPAISLRNDGVIVKRLVHRIVCEAYHGPAPTPRHEVAHNDGDPGNCNADNLRWATHAENEVDKIAHGTKPPRTYAKLTAEQVREIRAAPKYWGVNKHLAERFGVVHQTISLVRRKSGYWQGVE